MVGVFELLFPPVLIVHEVVLLVNPYVVASRLSACRFESLGEVASSIARKSTENFQEPRSCQRTARETGWSIIAFMICRQVVSVASVDLNTFSGATNECRVRTKVTGLHEGVAE
jgi:hypothetical protein